MISVRKPRFAIAHDGTWLPHDPDVATIIDVLHLLLPAGERFFCRVFAKTLPRVDDPRLRADIEAFIRQEGWHAKTHADLLDRGADPTAFTRWIDRLFAIADRAPLRRRVAIVAAVEHFTTVLGTWILRATPLDAAGADPEMLALLRWHGAEEVEHRAVAFDTARALDIGYVERQLAYAVVVPLFVACWIAGTRHLAIARGTRPTFRGFADAARRGLVPSARFLARATFAYLRPGYHPLTEGDTDEAVAYLDRVAA